jgi:hypothetical protein
MILYINYFHDNNPERKDEYIYCLSKNQSLEFVEKIYVFLERDSDRNDIQNLEKIEFINLDRRLEFKDIFNHCSLYHNQGEIICVLNLDIFIEDSVAWKNVDENFFKVGYPKKSMVLKRLDLTNINGESGIAKKSWKSGKFCDGWLFKTPLDLDFLAENFEFCVGGAPYCDNLMMYLMSKHYHTYSWGEKYKTYHLDICRKKNNPGYMIKNNKTDTRPEQRKREHACIPAFQNWEEMLKNQISPIVTARH